MSQAVINPEVIRILLPIAGACLCISFALLISCAFGVMSQWGGFILSLISTVLYVGISAVAHELHWLGLAGSAIVMVCHIAWIVARPSRRAILEHRRLGAEGYEKFLENESERNG